LPPLKPVEDHSQRRLIIGYFVRLKFVGAACVVAKEWSQEMLKRK